MIATVEKKKRRALEIGWEGYEKEKVDLPSLTQKKRGGGLKKKQESPPIDLSKIEKP